MKYILLMRHAKSLRDDARLKDFERPLSKRGRHDATMMGHFISKTGCKPSQLVSSTARRAKDTTQLVVEAADIDSASISWNEQLYYGSFEEYLRSIQQLPDEAETAMLVGHNPLVEEAVSALCSDGRNFVVRIPTAGVLCLEHISGQWNQIRPGTAHIRWMMIPEVVRKLF